MRRWLVIVNAMVCATTSISCATTPPPIARGTLQVRCQPADAEVYVDDHFAGGCAVLQRRALQQATGARRIEIRRQGYFTQYQIVTVAQNQTTAVQVALRALPAP